MPKTERILKVMQRVYERQNFTVREMAEEFSVSYRTMLRYLHELSELGVPLYATEGKHGGYSLLNTARRRELAGRRNEAIERVVGPGMQIVGVEMKAPFTAFYMTKTLKPKLWKELQGRVDEIPYPRHASKGRWIAAARNRQQVYHYVAGIEVTACEEVPEGMVHLSLPASEYAVYTHEGPSEREDIDQSYVYVLQRMKQRGMVPDPGRYSLERRNEPEASAARIYIPLQA